MQKKKARISIKTLLISISLSISIIPIVILSARSFFVSATDNNDQFEKNSKVYSEVASNVLNTIIEQNKSYLSQLINMNVFDNSDENNEKLHNNMKYIAETTSDILDIYYSNELKQTIEGSLAAENDYTDREWYKNAIKNPERFSISNVYKDTSTNAPVITISKAVYNENVIVGVIALDIDLSTTSSEFEKIKINGQGECFIVDKENNVILSTDPKMINEKSPIDNYKDTISYTYDEESWLGKACDIYGTDLTAIVSIKTSDLHKSLNSNIIATCIIALVSLITTISISIIISNRIYNNLKTISNGMNKASDGDFSEKIELTVNNEFSDLADNFNNMTQNISMLIKNVLASINDVDQNSNILNKSSENVSESMSQVTKAIEQITEGTVESAKDLEDISASINNLSNEMQSMMNSVHSVNTLSKDTSSITLDGLNSVDELKTKSKETLNNTNDVKKVVDEVCESIKKIESMNETIASITAETNMLALNAAIESARAGEAGKGFAVVADQIKKLAEQTALSASQINSVIKDIEDKAKTATISVENANMSVVNQDSVLIRSVEIFNKLQSNVDILTEQIINVHQGILKVNTVKDNVNEKVQNLSVVMEETAAGAEEVAASAKEVDEASLNVVKISNELKDLSSLLENDVNKFIISE